MLKNFIKNNSLLTKIFFVFIFFVLPQVSSADVLLPGNISTCGELAISGTYTLTANVSGGASTCFLISSDNVTIEGGGFTVSGSGSTAIDARAYTSNSLTEGADAYTNLIINDITLSGYTTGIDLSGNTDTSGSGVKNGYAGDGGDIAIYYSVVGSVKANGGDSYSQQYGGLGGNILFTDTDLNMSNSTISALGGGGASGSNTNGVLDLNYSGTINQTGLVLSALSYLNDNTATYASYPGGSIPLPPGDISTCGTLYATTSSIFTLTQNISNISGTCFTIYGNDITLDGAGYSITSATTTNTSYAINASSYSNFTLASTTVTDFSNLITSNSSVTVSGHNLDLSDKHIAANSLTLTYTGILNKAAATVSSLTGLTVNGTSYGAQVAGLLLDWIAHDSNRTWQSIASSADGTKLAAVVQNGQIYTSTDSGATWTPRDSNRDWNSITSSADGTKLAAAVSSGQIYTSTDSGATWTARDSNRAWRSIASSADGIKLAAAVSSGQIYTSTDSGATWTARDSNRGWISVASSADGTKLVAAVDGGQIYTSTDSGATWTARDSNRGWFSIASSSDGTELVAVVSGGQIYTSTDSGATWTARESSRSWISVASSADGTKLAAVVFNGQIYTSTDSGATWTARELNRLWRSVASSADGTKLAAAVDGGQIYTHQDDNVVFSIDILSPSSGSTRIWTPSVVWGTASSCYYSFDNFTSTSTANCSLGGSDIAYPGTGSKTLYVKAFDGNGALATKSVSFILNPLIIITSPVSGSTVTSWASVVDWNPYDLGNISSCYYSYNSFTSTSTASCAGTGSDILPPSVTGTSTLSLKSVDTNGNIGAASVSFGYTVATSSPSWDWTPYESNRQWTSIASSNDGTKLVAVVSNGQIYTSTDSGATWTARDSSRNWISVASSADGTKLAAVVYGGQIYTSTDSGATWTARDSNRDWHSVTSSADGTKLAAVVFSGQIYTSTDSGASWTARDSNRAWRSIASSADGTKLAAVASSNRLYTSTDSGATWTARDSVNRVWISVASSADGTKLIAVESGGRIYISTNSGVTLTARDSNRNWSSVTSSADGTKLAAAVYPGQIYTSIDSGATWTATESTRNWNAVAFSADGTKLAAVAFSGRIYISSASNINIVRPSSSQSVLARAWSSLVNWGTSVSCYYSYNNFVSTSTVSCGNNGTDIAYPTTTGTSTLYVRGIGSTGAVINQNVTFDFNTLSWTARDSNRAWYAIASSADGTKLAAIVYDGQIYTSTNSGFTWTARESARDWVSIASSADGSRLVAAVTSGQIYTSINSGITWTPRDSVRNWGSVASSADGSKLVATVEGGQIYTSTDSGATWTARDSNRLWYSVASSADGSKLVAVALGGQIYVSSNSGVTWAARDSNQDWVSVASSADGSRLVAAVTSGQIYTSTDSGATWIARDSNRSWRSVSSSADGTKLVATVSAGRIYTSNDSGATWTAGDSVRDWIFAASSADGTKLAAVVQGGNIYTLSLPISIYLPNANSTISVWEPNISWSNSVTCQYSYDNSTWANASCFGTGSEIPAPSTPGLKTLYIKGTDFQNAVSVASSSFSYIESISGNLINACGIISTTGIYTLTADIAGVPGTCFVVQASNVRIDGNGHTVTALGGNTSYAVMATSYSGLTLKDIDFSGFGQGDVLSDSNVTYSGANIDLSNTSVVAESLTISYTNALTVATTYFSNLSSLIINGIDLGAITAGLFSWNQQNISSCTTLSSPGTYTLAQDVGVSSGTCFTITSDRVIIDGGGYQILSAGNGNSAYAIDARKANDNAYSNIVIKNLTIESGYFAGGIDASGADGTSGNSFGKKGGNVTLYNVTFPTDMISVNTKGGNGFYENNLIAEGGVGGNVSILNSIAGDMNLNGGDTNGDFLIGLNVGSWSGGSPGVFGNTNSTVGGTVTANVGAGYFPGCMDNGFSSYDPLATYDDGTCTNLVIGTQRDNPEGNTVSGPIDFQAFDNYGIVDGDATYINSSYSFGGYQRGRNFGTTTGLAIFNDFNTNDGTASNYGYVDNDAFFYSASSNNGEISGNASFEFGSNYGTVNGDAVFQSGSNYGTVNGDADFTQGGSYSAFNYGTINGNAVFRSNDDSLGRYNYGGVTGNITNIYGCTSVGALNYDSTALNDGGNCLYYGIGADLPAGVTYTGDLAFTGYSNFGIIDGNATFASGGVNYGTTTGNVTFYDYIATYDGFTYNGIIVDDSYAFDYQGTGIVGGVMYDATASVFDYVQFNGARSNQYLTQSQNVYFYDSTYNASTVMGHAVFADYSFNNGRVVGDATFYTLYYGSSAPASGVMSFNNMDWSGEVTGQVYGGDNQPVNTFAFYGNARNTGTIHGNAIFYDTSYNAGTVLGNVTYMNATAGTLSLTGSMRWQGTVSGTIKGSDNANITSLVFNDSSTNEISIDPAMTVVFNDLSSNNGTILGDASFNGIAFKVGNVEGTATLGGMAQTLLGISNVFNFVKNALSRDTLYLDQGSVLNISGIATLLGVDANNLLSIRSTSVNSNAELNINGTLNANFLRLKNISNNGLSQNVSSLAIYDDGGNTGFFFQSNTTPSTRGGVTSLYTAPSLPPSRTPSTPGPTPTPTPPPIPTVTNRSVVSGTLDSFFTKNIKPLLFDNVKKFDIFDPNSKTNAGNTIIPMPFKNLQAPNVLKFVQLPSNFLTNVYKFVFNKNTDAKDRSELEKYIGSFGIDIRSEQDLARLVVKPIKLPLDNAFKNTSGLFSVKSNTGDIGTFLTYDKNLKALVQTITISTNQALTVSINAKDNDGITGTFGKTAIKFGPIGATLTTPDVAGSYILKTDSSPVLVSIQTVEPVKAGNTGKTGLWNWLKSWFK